MLEQSSRVLETHFRIRTMIHEEIAKSPCDVVDLKSRKIPKIESSRWSLGCTKWLAATAVIVDKFTVESPVTVMAE